METKFTAGPWRIRPMPEARYFKVQNDVDGSRCDLANVMLRDDAHLIAAAPDMYEALDEARGVLSDIPAPHYHALWTRMCNAIRRAEDALAKARGEPL